MTSKVSIISNAFVLLGKKPITVLNNQKPAHSAASSLYDLLLPDMLSKCPWRSAMTNQTLSRINEEPNNSTEWGYQFQLPTDPKMILLYNVTPTMNYQIYQDRLYCNYLDVRVDYVFEPSSEHFPAYFVMLMVYTIAYHLASQVTQQAKLTQFWYTRFTQQKIIAMGISANQIPSQIIKYKPIIAAHYV
jgi:hypothetical protein